MLQFWDLDLSDQIIVLSQVTRINDIKDVQTQGAILPHVVYDKRKSSTELPVIVRNIQTTDQLLHSVLIATSQSSFIKEYTLNDIRGIILQKNGKPMFYCSNLLGYDSKQVAVIYLDDLIDSPRIEYHYGDTIPNRWKILYAGVGFALITFLLDSANTFPIRIG
jgi:hypothetical protein